MKPSHRLQPRALSSTWLAIILVVAASACCACRAFSPEVRISLSTVYPPDTSGSGVFQVDAEAAGVPTERLDGARVSAQVWDAEGHLVGEYECFPVPDSPSQFSSEPFAIGSDTVLGDWTVKVNIAQGDTLVASVETIAAGVGRHDSTSADDMGSTAGSGPIERFLTGPLRMVRERVSSLTLRIGGMGIRLTGGPFVFGLLVAGAAAVGFVGVWRLRKPLDPVQERAKEYGLDGELEAGGTGADEYRGEQRRWPKLNSVLARMSLGLSLAKTLSQADLPMTAAEFALLTFVVGLIGFAIGALRLGLIWGLALGLLLMYLPIMYLSSAKQKRQRTFTEQLPDMLTLMVGALRAGHGLTQALQTLVDQLPPPASKEIARVMRAVALGLPVQEALNDMAERVATDDVQMVVTAINVQYEMGGNLAETLDIAGETIRDRIFMQRQIQVLTAEERLSGLLVGALPIVMAVILFVMNPRYMMQIFSPGAPAWVRLMPLVAVLMQVAGFLVIRKIVDIEV